MDDIKKAEIYAVSCECKKHSFLKFMDMSVKVEHL